MARFQVARILGIICVFVVHHTRSALVSSPFDNFRIECPHNAGAQRLSIRMVESQGMKRQDTVFSISCNNIDELYPWNGIPEELAAIDREECHYSAAFDPIMDNESELSCGPREYIASVVRLYGTKIQFGCCKLRTREETNCVVQRFGKPFGVDVRTEIENHAMLINSISVDGNYFLVRFCHLAPRAAGLIVEDAKKAELRTSPKTTVSTVSTVITTQKTTTQPPTTTVFETTEPVIDTTIPKRVIKVKQPVISNLTAKSLPDLVQPDLSTILQSSQSVENIDENQITGNEVLHGTSIVGDKNQEAPKGLEKIASDGLPKNETFESTIAIETTTESTTSELNKESTLPIESTLPVEITKETTIASESTPISESTFPVEIMTTIASDSTFPIETTKESTTVSESTLPIETTPELPQNTTPESKIEIVTELAENTTPSPTNKLKEESSPSTQKLDEQTPDLPQKTTPESEIVTESITKTINELTTPSPTNKLKEESSPSTQKLDEQTAKIEISTTPQSKLMKIQETQSMFIAVDGHNTETMFPKVINSDYDEGGEDSKNEQSKKEEADKLMKSIMEMMNTKKEINNDDTNQLFRDALSNKTEPITNSIDKKLKKLTTKTVETTESSVLIVAKKYKTVNDGQTRMGENDQAKEIKQSDQTPLIAESTDDQKKLDEFVDRAPFDFSAFPHPPENSEPAKQVAEIPRYNRIQLKTTTKLPLPTISTTKEPEYIVADSLNEIPEPIPLKPRRNFDRASTLRRRPASVSPYVDEETNSSPFDVGSSDDSQKTARKTDSGFVDESLNHHDLFDGDISNEQASEGRFSLPTDSRFSQRSPFEIRRAPTPHISDPYHFFAEKYSVKPKQRQSVDILFETPVEEEPILQTETPMPISHKDGERSFTPADNKPMKAPEPSMFSPTIDEHPTRLTFLRKKQQDPMKMVSKQPLPDSNNQLVPMMDDSLTQPTVGERTLATVALPPLVPATRTRLTTILSTEIPSTIISSTEIPSTLQTTEEIQSQTTETLTTIPESTKRSTSTVQQTQQTQQVEELPSEPEIEPNPEASTQVYNPIQFYHTAPPRRQFLKEKILTFCSKDTAIRDINQMVIACGIEDDIWVPNRCPESTECFISPDSLYRICCPVGQ